MRAIQCRRRASFTVTPPPFSQPPFELSDNEPRRWGTHLFKASAAILALIEVYYGLTAEVRTPTHLYLGLAIIALAFLPALLWARRGRASLPVFETLLLTGANTYALPLLNGHSDLVRYSDDTISEAALGVSLFQLFAIATYQLVVAHPTRSRFWHEDILSDKITRWLSHGIALNTVYIFLSTFTTVIPDNIASVLRAIFFGLGIICMFITSRRLGQGMLSQGERAFFFLNLVVQCICMLTTLFLVSAISLLLLTLVGYISASGRVPLIATGVCLVLLAILHNGKAPLRVKYWESENPTPHLVDLPSFFTEWFTQGLRPDENSGGTKKMTSKLIDRTSLFHILCLVVSNTPAYQPYLNGETYRDIPAQFVPRLLWPNKPLGHVSTSKLSIYYGLQNEEDTYKTTIGFGMLSEACANFGFFGLAGLGALIGFTFKKIQGWAEGGPFFSYGGLLLIILMAWSFQVEFTLSIWIASLYQAAMAVLGIPFIIRNFIGP